ncbi:MAG TPA: hypothetical protein VFH33_02205 [Candidatus Krumholzibacteria bacterium]|nr:hypothetical protein [Candidatus Krumholzibacteria bacterium]
MKRSLFLLVLWLAASPLSVCAADWVPQPCQVDIKYYFKFDDQREVARMLRKACSRCMMDVSWTVPADSTLLLGCGAVVPDKSDHALADQARSLMKRRHPDQELVFVLKMTRYPTLEEFVHFMEMGVRFYREIPHYSYVVRADASTVAELEGMKPIEWMGSLKVEQKYRADYKFDPDWALSLSIVPSDTTSLRSDIESLGGTVLSMCGDCFFGEVAVRIDLARLKEVASLWWVLLITQYVPVGDGPEGN